MKECSIKFYQLTYLICFTLCLISCSKEQVLPPEEVNNFEQGLIAYWNFDLCDFEDHSSNSNHLLKTINVTCENSIFGEGAVFTGDESYLTVPDKEFDINSEFTISLWFNADSLNNEISPLIGKFQNMKTSPYLLTLSKNRIQFAVTDGNGTSDLVDANVTIESNQWYHLVVTNDTEQFKIFLDGLLIFELPKGVSLVSGDEEIYIGSVGAVLGNRDYSFIGMMDEIRLYDRVMLDSEVEDLHYWK